jgi:hypothetical protein
MKNLFTTILITVFAAGSLLAQLPSSNLVFFSENGERFIVIMNGLRYNDEPATNVRLTDLSPNRYKVKIILEQEELGQATTTINLDPALERTFNIRAKKKTAVGNTFNRMGNQVARDLNVRDTTTNTNKELYVIRWISDVPLAVPIQAQQPVYQQVPPAQQQSTTIQSGGTVQQTTTTTVRTDGVAPVGGTGVNMSVNDPALGVNFNMSVGTPTGTVQQTTTTTTTVSGGAPVQQQTHYVMPGYGGPIGCPWPMQQQDFNAAKSTIAGKSFEDTKLTIAQQVFNSNCMTSAQVTEILGLFTFEDSKIDFAKFAYGRTYDIGNYYLVNNAFTFESSIDDLNDYISSYRR